MANQLRLQVQLRNIAIQDNRRSTVRNGAEILIIVVARGVTADARYAIIIVE